MSWHLLEKGLDEIARQSTFFGKAWVTFFFILRVIPLTRMGETAYGDEQAAFKCNARQSGCENVCFNQFSPISPVRFWGFQMVVLATPPLIFLIYASQVILQIPSSARIPRKMAITDQQESKFDSSKFSSRKLTEFTSQESGKTGNFDNQLQHIPIGLNFSDNKISKSSPKNSSVSKHNQRSSLLMLSSYQKNFTQTQQTSNNFIEDLSLKGVQYTTKVLQKEYFHNRKTSTHSALFQQIRLSQVRFFFNDQSNVKEEFTDNHSSCFNVAQLKQTAFSSQSNLFSSFNQSIKLAQIEDVPQDGDHALKNDRNFKNIKFEKKDFNKRGVNISCRKPIERDFDINRIENWARFEQEKIENNRKQTYSSNQNKKKRFQAKSSFDIIATAYFIQCFTRLVLEMGFLFLQHQLFQFDVPELYKCKRWPCPKTVDCYISRSNEKTFMLYFMFNSGILNTMLTSCEIFFLVYRKCQSKFNKRKAKVKKAEKKNRLTKRSTKDPQISQQLTMKKQVELLKKRNELRSRGGWMLNAAQSGGSSDETGSFNSAELSAMLDKELEFDEMDVNEDQNDDTDGFD